MGLFGKRKKNTETTINNEASKKSNMTDSAEHFYSKCVEDFHLTSKTQGLANKGLIFIPELMPYGEKTVLAFLKDPFFQMEFGSNPKMYYYAIMSFSLQAGIVFAEKWHSDYPALKDAYVDEIITMGPADACKPLLKMLGLTDSEKENAFYNVIFKRWLAMHEPYWELNDPRDYTYSAMLAAYQLGISMILEKLGY